MEIARRQQKHLNVVRSNELVNARLEFTADQYKLILCAAAQIRQDDEDFTIYWVDIHHFRSLKESNNKGEGTRLRRMTRELLSQPIELLTDNGYEQFNFISYAKYEGLNGRVGIRFDPAMKPHLLQLKKNFTVVRLDVIVRFSSFYTMRIYELLKQFQVIGTRQMTLAELHIKLATPDSYRKNFNSFKKRVLDTAQCELDERGDITFQWTPIKDGKAVVAVAFVIRDRAKQKPQLDTPASTPVEEELEECLVKEFRLTRAQARHVLDKYAPKYIRETLAIVRDAVAAGRVKNLAAYTYSAFERDYRDKTSMPVAPVDRVTVEMEAVEHDAALAEAFEQAQDEAIRVLLESPDAAGVFDAFESILSEANPFLLEFYKKQLGSAPLVMAEHYPMFGKYFRAFVIERYLPKRFASLDQWLTTQA